jgi:hypothetical protein
VVTAAAAAGIAVFAWRAIVRPAPTRAAYVGACLFWVPLASLVDIMAGLAGQSVHDLRANTWPTVMLVALAVSAFSGGLTCLAAWIGFGRQAALPEARQL